MSKSKSNQGFSKFLWVIVLLGVGLGCQITSPRPASWAGTPTAEALGTVFALTQNSYDQADFIKTLSTATPISSLTPTTTLTATPALNKSGAWLLYPASNGKALLAHQINSGEIIEINLPEPIITADLMTGLSPDNQSLFVRAGSVMNAEEFALYQVDLTSFTVNRLTSLMSITLQRQVVNQEGSRAVDALAYVSRPDGLAWSPDGRFLAFTAALNNDNSDLYVYDTFNQRIDRVNFFLSQNASPIWSPTGEWLLSQEHDLNSLQNQEWQSVLVTGLIAPSFILVDNLFQPPKDSLEEVFVGWLNENIFISYSLTNQGARYLRSVSLHNLKENLIFEETFKSVAVDPTSKAMVFILSYEQAIPLGQDGGVYRFSFDGNAYQILQEGQWDQLYWGQAGFFIASGSLGILLINPNGEHMLLPNQDYASISPDGNWVIAWNVDRPGQPGAHLFQVNNNASLQTLITERVENIIWQPDSKAFFIQSEGTLYHFTFPNLKPAIISVDLPKDTPIPMVWVDENF